MPNIFGETPRSAGTPVQSPLKDVDSVIVDFEKITGLDSAKNNHVLESVSVITNKSDEELANEYHDIVQTARRAFESGRTKPIEFREQQLKALLRMYEEQRDVMLEATYSDLRKSEFETIVLELDILCNDVRSILMNIRDWTKKKKVSRTIFNWLDDVYILQEPYGVAAVFGTWNFPFLLTLAPVHGAIAAGNCVIIKPSEIATECSRVMSEIIPKYLDNECFHVVLGSVRETTELLKMKFDYIFFTGSSKVGRIIHEAATEHLVPITLELGGKSPVFLDASADIHKSARRILWGKILNNGQTCIAPDYLLCTKDVEEKFLAAARVVLDEWFHGNIKESPDLSRFVSETHYRRAVNFLDNGKIAIGGDTDESEKYLSPTILTDIKADDPIMKEEIFGPILPVVTVKNKEEAVSFINSKDKPLALYVFAKDEKVIDYLMQETSSGGVSINETVMQFGVSALPFGGIGSSGMGSYHGVYSFKTFSHERGVLDRDFNPFLEYMNNLRYPPFTDFKQKFVTIVGRRRRMINLWFVPYLIVFFCGLYTSYGYSHVKDKFKHH